MKIQITQDIEIDAKLKERYTFNELDQLIFTLNNIKRVFGKSVFTVKQSKGVATEYQEIKHKTYIKRPKDRKVIIQMIKDYYNSKNKNEVAEKYNFHNNKVLQLFIYKSKAKYHVQPREVGLKQFPTGRMKNENYTD